MASYPSAVKTFTTKNAGDTLQPSHINDVQDEITAMQDGLLNGTAPVNSSRITAPSAQFSNSTISSLTVGTITIGAYASTGTLSAGDSTLASLTVSSNVSGGSATFANLSVTAAPPAAFVSNGTNINTASGSTTRLTFPTQSFVSVSGLHSTTTNPSRVNLTSSGVWLAAASLTWGNNSSGDRTTRILLNGTAIASERINAVSADFTQQAVTALVYASDTASYVELEVIQDSGSTLSVVGATAAATFNVAKLR